MPTMQSTHFILDRREKCDVLTCRTSGGTLVLLPGELEELARFLSPLHEEIVLEAHRRMIREGTSC